VFASVRPGLTSDRGSLQPEKVEHVQVQLKSHLQAKAREEVVVVEEEDIVDFEDYMMDRASGKPIEVHGTPP
jgi:hypothetical protein